MSTPDETPPAPKQPERLSFRDRMRRGWTRLRGGELTPDRAARSVGVGLFIGILPLPGLHLPMVVGVCLPLRLDAAVAYLAANISIPPIAVFLWLASIQLGARVLRGQFVPLDRSGVKELMKHGPGQLLGSLALGSVILATVVALLGATLTYFISQWRKRKREHVDALAQPIERTARRFERAAKSRGTYYYVRGKLKGDPATRAVASLGPLGHVLDLGCGRGQLDVLLLEAEQASSIEGWDWDDTKLDVARAASDGLALTVAKRDIRGVDHTDDTRSFDAVLLIDALHYFHLEEQDTLLMHAAKRVNVGGRLILRDADLGRGWRSQMTLFFERVGTAIRFNRGERVRFRSVERELVPMLERVGFRCEVRPCWGGTPFSNVLLVATRETAER